MADRTYSAARKEHDSFKPMSRAEIIASFTTGLDCVLQGGKPATFSYLVGLHADPRLHYGLTRMVDRVGFGNSVASQLEVAIRHGTIDEADCRKIAESAIACARKSVR